MEVEIKERRVRVLCGHPSVVETLINELLDHYAPTHFAFNAKADEPCMIVVLVHEKELRKNQIAMPMGPPRGRMQ